MISCKDCSILIPQDCHQYEEFPSSSNQVRKKLDALIQESIDLGEQDWFSQWS